MHSLRKERRIIKAWKEFGSGVPSFDLFHQNHLINPPLTKASMYPIVKTEDKMKPAQAKRMARWRARRKRMTGFIVRSPLRPGVPPGHRRRGRDEIDRVLLECHDRAWVALRPDSS